MCSRKSRKSKYNCCKKNNFYKLIDFLIYKIKFKLNKIK